MEEPRCWSIYSLSGIGLVLGRLVTCVDTVLPDVGRAPDIATDIGPARVERGRCLAWHDAHGLPQRA